MPKAWVAIICLIQASYLTVYCGRPLTHPEMGLTLEQRIQMNGYPVETHRVETEDDYILSLYHIPHGLEGTQNGTQNKSVVMLLHGMGGSPHNFILLGTRRASAFHFADKGLDVWLMAARGVEGSFKEKHKTLNWNKDEDFWKYGMHEIGVYDIAASIDHILNYTGQEKVSLIGHSAGGYEIFCLLAHRPEYNAKITVGISYGSSPIMRRFDYPIVRLGCEAADLIKGIYKFFGLMEAFPLHEYLVPIVKTLCRDSDFTKACYKATGAIGGHTTNQIDPVHVVMMIDNIPRLSSRMVYHYLDNIKNESFRYYDHGPRKNMKIYGQKTPPRYNLSAITAPIAFFIGRTDSLISIEDVYESMEYLPNTVMVYEIPYPKFNHIDMVFARNAVELLFDPTYKLINDLESGIVLPALKPPENNKPNP